VSGGASNESYSTPVALDRPDTMSCHASQFRSATESSPGSCALVISNIRAEPSRDFAKFRAIALAISWPSLFASQ
jgi:hypothetical protein